MTRRRKDMDLGGAGDDDTAGADAYPSLEGKAAALPHSLVRSQALVDGDKRWGLAVDIAQRIKSGSENRRF